jgi:mRNA interferase RelE/StbE
VTFPVTGLRGFAFSKAALDFVATIPPKVRQQVLRKARALQHDPFPQGHKRLKGVHAVEGDAVFRERSGDYRILYVVRDNPNEVLIIDIDHRKDVYR